MDEGDAESSGSGSNGPSDKYCSYCGAAIERSEWYPVTKERDAAGSLRFYSFCSEACQTAWLDDRSE